MSMYGCVRELAVLGVVVGALDVVDARADRDRAAVQRALARQAGELRQLRERDVHLARRAAHPEVADRLRELVGKVLRVDELQEAALGIGGRHHDLRVQLVAVLERHAGRAAAVHDHLLDGGAGADLDAERARGARDRRADAAGAVLREAPGAERAVDLAHVVVQQHVGGAGRARPEERADDAARRLGALERIELEPLVEQVGRGLRHELGDPVELRFAQARAVLAELQQAAQVAPAERRRIGRHEAEHRLDRLGGARHHARILVGGLGIARRVAVDLAARQVVVVPGGEVVAVVQRRDGARQRQDLEAVPRQFEVADDLGPQQADHVRELGEAVAREDLLGDRGAADDVAPLEHHDLLARAREVGAGDQAVVARADDDRVVACRRPSLASSTRARRTAARPPCPARGGDGARP